MNNFKKSNLETLALHAGYDNKEKTCAVPIYQTVAYPFEDVQHAADLFNLKEQGYIYTRISNPTNDVLENRISILEGGVAAVAFASGHAAITSAILNLAQQGDEIISSSNLYGGTYNLFKHSLKRLGIIVKLIDTNDKELLKNSITEKTKAIFAESIGNPSGQISDIENIAKIAHYHNIPLIIDATFATPYLQKPIDYGADIVIHSMTKFIGGHGTALGGIVVDSGNFDFNNSNHPLLNSPDPSYHNINYAKELGKYAYSTRLRVQILRDFGATISPFNSFLLLNGIQTLALRMKQHTENALKIAEYLQQHSKISWINYPSLKSNSQYELAEKYFPKGAGCIFTFGIKGGLKSGEQLINNLKLITHLANVGDTKTLIIHPASTTHSQLSSAEREKSGVADDLIRISVGIENADDIIDDLQQALEKI